MYDLSSKFNTFYREHVVLPQSKVNELLSKKNINIERLKEGLEEYNDQNNTQYKLMEHVIQGSVAMSTVIQNDDNNYDIDVATIFNKNDIDLGTTATKNMVVDVLKKRCLGFKKEPEVKTNCVRIIYEEGYHIDFAIYRRWKENEVFCYEHCGSTWRDRNPRAILKWFMDRNQQNNGKLREILRLLKMFVKSRESWVNMPGGLILSVLVDEQFKQYERIDERFYYTISAIKDRLSNYKDVLNPTDMRESLILTSDDENKMRNLHNRLTDKISLLEVLLNINCTQEQAIEAWEKFFNHGYWTEQKEKVAEDYIFTAVKEPFSYGDTEEFIEHYYPVELRYEVNLDCKIKRNDIFEGWLRSTLKRRELLHPNRNLTFVTKTNTPYPYDIYWKIKNEGSEAERLNCVRGQIVKGEEHLTHNEETHFKGNHYVECYIIKNGVCVAKNRIAVPIKFNSKKYS